VFVPPGCDVTIVGTSTSTTQQFCEVSPGGERQCGAECLFREDNAVPLCPRRRSPQFNTLTAGSSDVHSCSLFHEIIQWFLRYSRKTSMIREKTGHFYK